MAELLWKNMLVSAALEDQYVKSEVYKPNCKCLPVKSSKKAFVLCKWICGNKLSLLRFINDWNDAVSKRLFPPNFQAWCINSNLKPLTKFSSSSGSTEFEDILPWNLSQMITKTILITTRIIRSYAVKWSIPFWVWQKINGNWDSNMNRIFQWRERHCRTNSSNKEEINPKEEGCESHNQVSK